MTNKAFQRGRHKEEPNAVARPRAEHEHLTELAVHDDGYVERGASDAEVKVPWRFLRHRRE